MEQLIILRGTVNYFLIPRTFFVIMVRNWSTSYGVQLTDQKLCMTVNSSFLPPRAALDPLEAPSNACNVHQLGLCLSLSHTLWAKALIIS